MKVMLIDDEKPGLEEIAYLLGKYPDLEIAGAFNNPLHALEAMGELKPDAVFLDIDMPYMDGLELALRIQAQYAGIIIVFVTAYSKFALDAFKAYPLDYILKPIKEARLEAAVEHMRKQYALMNPKNASVLNNLKINCFGKFNLTLPRDFEEVKWGTRRVRELFLYLVDRCGQPATRTELLFTMFPGQEEKKAANNLYVTTYKLRSLLDHLDPERRLVKLGDNYSLEINPGICDYTDFMTFSRQNPVIASENAVAAARVLNLCQGGYLEGEDCSWAVDSAAFCELEYERIALGLAGVHISGGRAREAENILSKLLQKNPLSDEAYTLLLDIHMRDRNDRAYAARYLEYARMLMKEFGEEPASEYTCYYNKVRA
ncbi:MAG: response regulator [Syntrophomonadaceae bacterium]